MNPNDESSTKKRILFIDDEAINLLSLRSVFRRDYEVHTAMSAEEAIRILADISVDIVVSDQRMPPGMSGTAFFASMPDRTGAGLRLILTAYPEDSEVRNALERGLVDSVLEKPLESRLLIDYIEAYEGREAAT